MDINKIKEEIIAFYKSNPQTELKAKDVAKMFGLDLGDKEKTNKYVRDLKRTAFGTRNSLKESFKSFVSELKNFKEDFSKGTLESTISINFEPKSVDELYTEHKINPQLYVIKNYWSKKQPNGDFTSSVFAVKKTLETDIFLQKNILLEELKKEFKFQSSYKKLDTKHKEFAYELNMPDMHFGKLAWNQESGEDYNLDLAQERYFKAISYLMSFVNSNLLTEIILPIGNDMLNIDSRKNETFSGTPQDSDSRFFKIVQIVKNVLIKTISDLSKEVPVKVIVVSGNHDPESMFMIGEILDAYFYYNPNVTIDNSPKQRKYYQYGKCGFQYTHGNEEKHGDLGLIFATEQPQLWAETLHRFAKLGHFHKNKKTNYVSVDDYPGFQVQILPSLSGADAWHTSKGYMANKQAKGFLYHKEDGEVAQFTYTIK